MILLHRVALLLLVLIAYADADHVKGRRTLKKKRRSSSSKSEGKGKGKGGKGKGDTTNRNGTDNGDDDNASSYEITLKITNLTYLQPFSSFVVVSHNRDADPLFVLGQQASEELALLAENGDPEPLFSKYEGGFGVNFAEVHDMGAPFFGGEVTYIKIPYHRSYPYITIASMAINTNDCFVALNGVYLSPGQTIEVPGYDAGTEVNNELCSSIPGPACPSGSGNVRSGNGEGYVHIHRGFKGVGDRLSEAGYDWRNPMMSVEVYM